MPDTATHLLHTSHAAPVILPAGSPQADSAKNGVLTPVNLSEHHVRLARLVRRGCFVRVPGAQVVFSIRPVDDAGAGAEWSDALLLETPGGPIEIADGARLIQGLTGIHPSLLQSLSGERRQWFAAALAGRLAGTPLAGALISSSTVRMNREDR